MPRPKTYKKRPAIDRFIAKCEFEPRTGCVLWTGGKTRGRGNTAEYGSFWYEGRRWFAHRWAAQFIHGLEPGADTVGHCCPNTPDGHPNTLCVHHVRVETLSENIAERNTRHAKARRAEQSGLEKQLWLLTERGYEPPPPTHDPKTLEGEVPFYDPPEWYVKAKGLERKTPKDDVPF